MPIKVDNQKLVSLVSNAMQKPQNIYAIVHHHPHCPHNHRDPLPHYQSNPPHNRLLRGLRLRRDLLRVAPIHHPLHYVLYLLCWGPWVRLLWFRGCLLHWLLRGSHLDCTSSYVFLHRLRINEVEEWGHLFQFLGGLVLVRQGRRIPLHVN